MTVSNKVVVFALLGLTVATVDYIVAHKKAQSLLACQQFTDNDSFFALSNMSSSSSISNTFQTSNIQLDLAKAKSKQIADYSKCVTKADNSVSWMDWVFSWQDSPTFHYLDLLELLTPVDANDNNAPSHPVNP